MFDQLNKCFLACVYHLHIRLGYPGNQRVIGVGIVMNHINDTFENIKYKAFVVLPFGLLEETVETQMNTWHRDYSIN